MYFYYNDKGKHIGIDNNKYKSVRAFINHNEDDFIVVKKDGVSYSLDIPSLTHKVNLDCLNCEHSLQTRSCCDGTPFSFDKEHIVPFVHKLANYVRSEFKPLIKLCTPNDISAIYSDAKETYLIQENSLGISECPLRYYDRCGLHKYMLEQNIPYYKKPCSWMYPLDVIAKLEKDYSVKEYLVFILTERTRLISRWGKYAHLRHCLNDDFNADHPFFDESYHLNVDKKKYFKSKDYKPAFVAFADEYKYMFGFDVMGEFSKKLAKIESRLLFKP